MIRRVGHSPLQPTPRETVTVTAQVEPAEQVELLYRFDGEDAWVRVLMTQREERWTATIPPQAEGAIVEFAVEAAVSGEGGKRRARYPPGEPGSCLFRVSDRTDSPLVRNYHLLLRQADLADLRANVASNDLRPATFVGLGRAFHDVRVRYRGSGSREVEPKSYRVRFTDDEPFDGKRTIFWAWGAVASTGRNSSGATS